jgi:radical SAM protein with 4Fe4S-binding SPASM domain
MQLSDRPTLEKLYWALPQRTHQRERDEMSLSTYYSYKVVDDVAGFADAEITFTATGSLEPRDSDLLQLVDYATRRHVRTTYACPDSRLLSREVLQRLKLAGLQRLALRLDRSTPAKDDGGKFDATLQAIQDARDCDLMVEVDSFYDRTSIADFKSMEALLSRANVAIWNVGLTYHGTSSDLRPDEVEDLFGMLFESTRHAGLLIQTSDAMHYRRVLLQRLATAKQQSDHAPEEVDGLQDDPHAHTEREIKRDRASLFLNVDGAVWPSADLPLPVGNVHYQPLHRAMRSPLLARLRTPEELKGKCSVCEYKRLCGGSRARAFLATGDPFAADPLCSHEPARLRALVKMTTPIAEPLQEHPV